MGHRPGCGSPALSPVVAWQRCLDTGVTISPAMATTSSVQFGANMAMLMSDVRVKNHPSARAFTSADSTRAFEMVVTSRGSPWNVARGSTREAMPASCSARYAMPLAPFSSWGRLGSWAIGATRVPMARQQPRSGYAGPGGFVSRPRLRTCGPLARSWVSTAWWASTGPDSVPGAVRPASSRCLPPPRLYRPQRHPGHVGAHRLLGALGPLGRRQHGVGVDLALEALQGSATGRRSAGGPVAGPSP